MSMRKNKGQVLFRRLDTVFDAMNKYLQWPYCLQLLQRLMF